MGETIVQSLGSATRRTLESGLSSGSYGLNYALSGNPFIGYGWGRIVETFGAESSGKTTLALHAVKEAQKQKLPVAYIDTENAVDPVYAEAIGVSLKDLVFVQPDYGEQAITLCRSFLQEGVKLIVVDSVAALVPKVELEGDTGDAFMGKQARLMGQAMRQLSGPIRKAQAVVIFINQTRMKIGVVFGSPETTTGGNALKFYSSYRLKVSAPRGGAEKEKISGKGEIETGIDTNITVVKNKLYPPFRKATVHIEYGRGINSYEDAAQFLLDHYGDGKKVAIKGTSYNSKKLSRALESVAMKKIAIDMMKKVAPLGKEQPE